MRSLTGWYQNLKKWQKGGLIGCVVGLLFAVIIIIGSTEDSLGEWITDFHEVFFIIFHVIFYKYFERIYYNLGASVIEYLGSAAMIVFYGGLGAIWGRIQQINNPFWKWSLTALLALFLLLFYVSHII